jgi:CrcB protein
MPVAAFPSGTLAVNVIGCFGIGLAAGALEHRHTLDEATRAFFFIGFLGGFTTFSTFGYETYAMARNAQMLSATANVVLQIVSGLGAVWLGFALTRT